MPAREQNFRSASEERGKGEQAIVGLIEAAAYIIVGGAVGQAVLACYGMFQRRVEEARRAREDVGLLRERANLLLGAARAERDRTQLSWSGNRKFYLERRVTEAQDICSFYLRPHDRKPLPPFLPGQYLTFTLKIPGEAKPVVRCYSLSDCANEEGYYRITVKRLGPPPGSKLVPPGLSSNYFHRELKEGDILDVKAPAGHFYLDTTSDRPVVLIGGGVGLTPLLAMLNSIIRSGSRRETWFFYGVTNRNEHAAADHLRIAAQEHDNIHVEVCYSRPTDTCRKGYDYQHEGFVSVELMRSLLPSRAYEFYICCPPLMMETVTRDLADWGVPEADLHFEAFGPATVKKAPAKPEPSEAANGVDVTFVRSRKVVRWQPEAGSILDCAEANGVVMDFGCRAGNCGTCLTAIMEGKVSYLTPPGSEPEEGSCLACIAVPDGPLVLDY